MTDNRKNQKTHVHMEKPEIIIKALTQIFSDGGDRTTKWKKIADLLVTSFNASACIFASTKPQDGNIMSVDVFTGKIPHRENISEEEETEIIREIMHTARRSLSNKDFKIATATLNAGDKKLVGTISTNIEYNGKLIAMIVVVKDAKVYEKNVEVFNHIRPHLWSIIIQ